MLKYTIADFFEPDEEVNIGEGIAYGKEPLHTHEFLELTYILSGCAIHTIGGNSYEVSRGDILFINFHLSHEIFAEQEMKYVNILVAPSFVSDQLVDSENALDMLTLSTYEEFRGKIEKILPKISFKRRDIPIVEEVIMNMLHEFEEKQSGYQMAIKGYMQVLFVKIFRNMYNNSTGKSVLKSLGKITPEILQYIEDNCYEKFSISDLAKKSFYNPSYFSRVFKECFGMTITEYIQKRRVEEAIRLLKSTDMSVEKIAHSVGYNDKKQFYKSFNEITGVSPGKFRKQINMEEV